RAGLAEPVVLADRVVRVGRLPRRPLLPVHPTRLPALVSRPRCRARPADLVRGQPGAALRPEPEHRQLDHLWSARGPDRPAAVDLRDLDRGARRGGPERGAGNRPTACRPLTVNSRTAGCDLLG